MYHFIEHGTFITGLAYIVVAVFFIITDLVLGSPVPRLEKNQDQTALGPQILRTSKDHNRSLVFGPS